MTVEDAHQWMQGKMTSRYDYVYRHTTDLDSGTLETRIREADAAMMAIAYYTLEYHNKKRYGFDPESD